MTTNQKVDDNQSLIEQAHALSESLSLDGESHSKDVFLTTKELKPLEKLSKRGYKQRPAVHDEPEMGEPASKKHKSLVYETGGQQAGSPG